MIACGTCATYGGIHAMEGNPTGAMGLADYLGWDWKSKAGLPIVNVPGCPVQPDNFMETVLYLLYQVAGLAPMIPLDDQLRPTWLFGKTVHEGCDRAGYYEQGDFAEVYGSPKCIVKLGCWGPVVNCNVPKRGWMAGIGGCPNVGGICIGCTMPGFPDKFMPFMDEPPGARVSTSAIGAYGRAIRALRSMTQNTANKEPKWRHPRAELTTGYHPGLTDEDSRLSPKERSNEHYHRTDDRTFPAKTRNLVEMNWDPITRIVGSLGIFTKIDFENKQVAECHSTSSIFRGYSIFMKGKDPRDAHFITSRICGICGDNHATCATYAQNMAFGVKPPPMAEWIVNLGEAAEYMFDHNIFQDNLVGVDFCEQMVKETNPKVLGESANDRGAARQRARLPHHRRHHDGAQSVHRSLSIAKLCNEPHDARDVLPDGRPARPSFHSLSRRRGHRAHGAAFHRLPRPPDEVCRVHEEGRAAAR